jgi:hypothetical protein
MLFVDFWMCFAQSDPQNNQVVWLRGGGGPRALGVINYTHILESSASSIQDIKHKIAFLMGFEAQISAHYSFKMAAA